jgi:hypothetical protein
LGLTPHRGRVGHSHRDLRCCSSVSSPTTRSCIRPINSALWASVACISAQVSFEVVVVEPNKTTPPMIAAIAVMTAAGINDTAPRMVPKIHIDPPTMAILEICEIRRDLAIASARSSMRSSSRKISLCRSLSATHSPLHPSSIARVGAAGSTGNINPERGHEVLSLQSPRAVALRGNRRCDSRWGTCGSGVADQHAYVRRITEK